MNLFHDYVGYLLHIHDFASCFQQSLQMLLETDES